MPYHSGYIHIHRMSEARWRRCAFNAQLTIGKAELVGPPFPDQCYACATSSPLETSWIEQPTRGEGPGQGCAHTLEQGVHLIQRRPRLEWMSACEVPIGSLLWIQECNHDNVANIRRKNNMELNALESARQHAQNKLHKYTYVCIQYAHVYTCIYMYTYLYIHTCIHSYLHAYIHTNIYNTGARPRTAFFSAWGPSRGPNSNQNLRPTRHCLLGSQPGSQPGSQRESELLIRPSLPLTQIENPLAGKPYIYIHKCVCVSVCTHTYTWGCVHGCADRSVCTCMCVWRHTLHTCMHACMHTSIHVCIHYVHACIS